MQPSSGKKQPTSVGTEEEAMVKERIGSLAWLRKEVEQADDTDNPVVPTHVGGGPRDPSSLNKGEGLATSSQVVYW